MQVFMYFKPDEGLAPKPRCRSHAQHFQLESIDLFAASSELFQSPASSVHGTCLRSRLQMSLHDPIYAPIPMSVKRSEGLSLRQPALLGGSWVVINGVISPLMGVITIVTLILTPLITTHEPPSRPSTLYPYRIPIDPFKGTLKGTQVAL